jgi:hypothetical protein
VVKGDVLPARRQARASQRRCRESGGTFCRGRPAARRMAPRVLHAFAGAPAPDSPNRRVGGVAVSPCSVDRSSPARGRLAIRHWYPRFGTRAEDSHQERTGPSSWRAGKSSSWRRPALGLRPGVTWPCKPAISPAHGNTAAATPKIGEQVLRFRPEGASQALGWGWRGRRGHHRLNRSIGQRSGLRR